MGRALQLVGGSDFLADLACRAPSVSGSGLQ